MPRLIAPFLSAVALAFAPLPFPGPNAITPESFQGRWRVVRTELTLPGGKLQPWDWDVKTIRVRGGHMVYLRGEASDDKADEFPFVIPAGKGVVPIDWWLPGPKPDGPPRMVGLMRCRGDMIQVLYKPGTGPKDRPKRFEDPPEGWYLKTIRRE